jgi:hypothetical protein
MFSNNALYYVSLISRLSFTACIALIASLCKDPSGFFIILTGDSYIPALAV